MRNLFLIIFILIQFPVLSQSLDGKFQIGGNASYSTNNTELERGSGADYELQMIERSQLSIIPQFGYFVSDIVSIGGQIGYRRNTYSNTYEVNPYDRFGYIQKDNTINLGIFTRVHKPVSDNLYLFLQGNVDFGFGKVRYEENQNNDQNRFDFSTGIEPGILFMVSEKFGIESTFGFLGYQSTKRSPADSTNDNNTLENSSHFGLRFHPSSFSLGLQFYL